MKNELWKDFHNSGFFIAFTAGLLICIIEWLTNIGIAETFIFKATPFQLPNGSIISRAGVSTSSLYYFWMGIPTATLGNMMYYFLFPLFAAMPSGILYEKEKISGYSLQMAMREGRFRYHFNKMLAGMITGGITVSAPPAINFILGITLLPLSKPLVMDEMAPVNECQFGSLLFFRHPFLFVLLDLLVIFLWGAAMAAICLAAGRYIRKRYLAVFFPLLLSIVIELLFSFSIITTDLEWSPLQLYHLATIRGTSGIIIFGEIFVFIASALILFLRKGNVDYCAK